MSDAAKIEISFERERLDVAMVHEYLTHSYWAEGRSYEAVLRSIDNSLCCAAFVDGAQIGFARVISDRAVFAYLADVFVLPEARGQGASKRMIESILAHPELQNLRVFWLATKDAHALYQRYGFQALTDPGKYMAIHGPEAPPFVDP